MADSKKTEVDEIAELRERVKLLESELAKERDKGGTKAKDKGGKGRTLGDVLQTTADEVNKFSLGLCFAGLESIRLTADYTRDFIDKTTELNKGEKRDTVAKKLLYLPLDLGEGMFDALDKSTEMPGKLVDKFNEKYKEA
jgi:hypothetical protein